MWDPAMQARFPFREWAREVMLWSILVDMTPARKAAWVALNLRGQAQRLAKSIPPTAMINGGVINGTQVDALTFLMHSLNERYAPLGEESRLKAMTEIFCFHRLPQERVRHDETATRRSCPRRVQARWEKTVAIRRTP